jgi:hypothetical protein
MACGDIQIALRQQAKSNCCRGKAVCVTYFESVFVALGIQHEMRMNRILLS